MKVRSIVLVIPTLALFGLWVAWVTWARPRVVAGHQVRNWADMQIYTNFLEQYRQVHGGFPVSLADAVPGDQANRDRWLRAHDSYGHPLHYESDGRRFLLASFGRDGVRDGRDYVRRRPGDRADDSPCYDANVDTVFSSDGVFQACAK